MDGSVLNKSFITVGIACVVKRRNNHLHYITASLKFIIS
jgi:hypothetical protein